MSSITNDSGVMAGQRLLSSASLSLNRAMERLATGIRINRASDDPSGLMAALSILQDQSALQASIEGKERELSRLDAADGAASTVGDLLGDLQGLLTSAASTGGESKEERDAMNDQATSILRAIDTLAGKTTFDGQRILEGFATGKIGQEDGFSLSDLRDGGALNLFNGDLEKAQKVLDHAISDASTAQAETDNRSQTLLHELKIDLSQLENQAAATSLIQDADFAHETSAMMRSQTLQQSALFAMKMFAQSNSQSVLELIG